MSYFVAMIKIFTQRGSPFIILFSISLLVGCGLIEPTLPTLRDTFDVETRITSLLFTPDDSSVVMALEGGAIQVRAVDSGEITLVLDDEHSQDVISMAFSPDGKILASASIDRTIVLWRLSSGKAMRTLEGHDNAVSDVVFSPDGQLLASASWDTKVHLWQVESGKLLTTLAHYPYQANSVAFSPTGDTMATAAGSTLYFWQLDNQEATLLGTASDHQGPLWDITFAPDGESIATVSEDRTARLWRSSNGELLETLEMDRFPRTVAFTPTGSVLLINLESAIDFWRVDTQALIDGLNVSGNRAFAVSSDSKIIATSQRDEQISLWDMPASLVQ